MLKSLTLSPKYCYCRTAVPSFVSSPPPPLRLSLKVTNLVKVEEHRRGEDELLTPSLKRIQPVYTWKWMETEDDRFLLGVKGLFSEAKCQFQGVYFNQPFSWDFPCTPFGGGFKHFFFECSALCVGKWYNLTSIFLKRIESKPATHHAEL